VDGGRLVAAAEECLEVIAAYDMVLATGHVGRDEVFALVRRASELGVTRIVATHVEFPSIAMTADEQVELARLGALIEHCYTTAYTAKTTWETVFANVRRTGAAASLISTDLGQSANPPVSAGFADFADRLLAAGFSDEEVRLMAVVNPARLLEVD
jgi:predicted amidohydrolase